MNWFIAKEVNKEGQSKFMVVSLTGFSSFTISFAEVKKINQKDPNTIGIINRIFEGADKNKRRTFDGNKKR